MATASPSATFSEYTLAAKPVGEAVAQPEAHSGDFAMPLALFLGTMVTTCMMGARFAANFSMGLAPVARPEDMFPVQWILAQPSRLVEGIPFSFTILSILLAHELGHYYACRRHGVQATLPYFLPAPTLSGTMGAVIKLRTKVPNRAALLDIGVSGPFWGFLVALPFIFLGLLLSVPVEHGQRFLASAPPVFFLMNNLVAMLRPEWPGLEHVMFHPVLLACWIGMFVTFLNLLPAGQLDGGHVLYAVFPRMHKGMTNLLIGALLLASTLCWLGWAFWGILLMMPLMRHPKVPVEPAPEGGSVLLPWVALGIFAMTLMPAPFAHSSLVDLLRPYFS